MNEELKIIIKAYTDGLEKALKEAKKELDGVGKAGEKAGKEIDKGMGKAGKGFEDAEKKAAEAGAGIAKSMAVAVGAVAALVTGLVALGKSSLEFQKEQAKLNASFQAVGSSAQQASTTYKELFGFLGDTQTAVEAAQQLANITQEEKTLAEYTTILQGVYAKWGASIETAGLAEGISHTIALGEVQGTLADALEFSGISVEAFNAQLAQCNTQAEREALIRSTLNGLYGNAAAIYGTNNAAMISMNQAQAEMDIAMAEATRYIAPLLTELYKLGAVLLQTVAPAIQIVAGVIIQLVQWIAVAIKAIGSLFGAFSGKSAMDDVASSTDAVVGSVSNATAGVGGMNNALGGATKSAKELKKQTMGFDELNVVSKPAASGGAGGGGAGGGIGGVSMPSIEGLDTSAFDTMTSSLQDFSKEIEGLAVALGLAAAGFAAFKITNFIKDVLAGGDAAANAKGKLKQLGGTLMIAGGAMLTLSGYTDAWANGIDWGNLTEILAGLGLIVGGLALSFGSLAAQIGLITGGIALVVLGVVDLINNGYSMEAVITVTLGVLAILIGVIWALNAALLANPITWIVAAIIALIAVFVILWNECEGFRNFWKQVWDAIKTAFKAVWEWLKGAAEDIAQFFVDAWEAIKTAWNAVTQFFSDIWDGICEAFNATVDWFSGIFSDAWQGIKDAFSAVGSFFSGIWDDIKSAFSSVTDWFKNTFSEAWGKVKDVFEAGGEIFQGIAESISNIFCKVVNGIIDGINTVIAVPFDAINGVLKKIKGVEIVGYKPFKWIKTFKVPKIPHLATGGIVDSDTIARIGEQGYREAVLPLERNTEWMDVLAERINQRNNTPTKIVLMLDERELGWANVDSINSITEETGTLQLRLV